MNATSSLMKFQSDVVPSHSSTRMLGEPDVALYVTGGEGMCQIRNSLDTLYNGEKAAFSAVFTVEALADKVDIQGLEFANMEKASEEGNAVTVYVQKSNTFSTNPDDWIILVETTSVPSPDGLGSIAPRADFKRSVALNKGDVWMFYVTTNNANLKMADSTTATGSSYQSDDFLQLNVGQSVTTGSGFSADRTANQAFQGKLYYRVLESCNSLLTETTVLFPFATKAGTDKVELNAAVSAAFDQLLVDEKDLARWVDLNGLTIKSIVLKNKGTQDDCNEYEIEGGCDLYDTDLIYGHFQSLSSRELVLELTGKFDINGLGNATDQFTIVYTGDQVIQEKYDLTMTGVPYGTVLKPEQRLYLEKVTYDFLDEFSGAKPHRVEISQVVGRRRQLLRGHGEKASAAIDSLDAWGTYSKYYHRMLTPPAELRVEVVVSGIGHDTKDFTAELDKAFMDNSDQYKEEVQKQQYLPGEINDKENMGEVFSGLLGIKVAQAGSDQASEPSGTTAPNDKMDSKEIQIIAFSCGIGLAALFLLYRVLKDCVWVKEGWEVKQERLSEKISAEGTTERPELVNMDKPRQRPTAAIDASTLPTLKVSEMDGSEREESSVRRGRRPPTSRGVGRAKSSDDIDLFAERASSATIPKQDLPPTAPTRNVGRYKSADGDSHFFESVRSEKSARSARSSQSSSRSAGLSRGMGRARSNDDVDLLARKASVSDRVGRPAPASRGIRISKSSDGSGLFGSRRQSNTPSGKGRLPPAERGVRKSSTFSGIDSFLGKQQGNGASNGPPSVASSSAKEKRGKVIGEGSPSLSKSRRKKAVDKSTDIQASKGSSKKKKKKKTDEKGKKSKKRQDSMSSSATRALRARTPKIISAPELLDRWVGGSEKLVRGLFAEAEAELAVCNGDATKSALHVIVIDEIDAVFRRRSSGDDSGETTRASVVNQILSKLDGINQIGNVLLIGMTNRRELLDEALLRPGRLEVQSEVPLPDKEGRREILQIHFEALRRKGRLSVPLCQAMNGEASNWKTKETLYSRNFDEQRIRKRDNFKRGINKAWYYAFSVMRPPYDLAADIHTGGYSGADIAGLVRCAGSLALSRARRDGNGVDGLLITLEDVKQALKEVKPLST